MITITNEKDSFTIDEKELKKDKGYLNYVGADDYCEIVLSFVFGRKLFKKKIIKIQKCLASSEDSRGDALKDYKNLKTSNNKVLLSDEDYEEVARLVKNMSEKDTLRKKIVINSFAPIVAYECYRYFKLSELEDEVDMDFIWEYVCCTCLYYKEKIVYKKDILNKAKEILRKEYKIDIDQIFKGGKKDE